MKVVSCVPLPRITCAFWLSEPWQLQHCLLVATIPSLWACMPWFKALCLLGRGSWDTSATMVRSRATAGQTTCLAPGCTQRCSCRTGLGSSLTLTTIAGPTMSIKAKAHARRCADMDLVTGPWTVLNAGLWAWGLKPGLRATSLLCLSSAGGDTSSLASRVHRHGAWLVPAFSSRPTACSQKRGPSGWQSNVSPWRWSACGWRCLGWPPA
mmetsp:Transcript_73410/g.215242  ORF Transcript_73410/g.215242 Transcript_73410/m.215242 type:complete len:210 (-) Transcript_73410:485-1114(-)